MDQAELVVTVAYCAPGIEDIVEVRVARGATVGDAIDASGLLARRTELGTAPDVGIWGRPCSLQQRLRDADRVEVYRGLKVDPKEARRIRARVRRQRKIRAA